MVSRRNCTGAARGAGAADVAAMPTPAHPVSMAAVAAVDLEND